MTFDKGYDGKPPFLRQLGARGQVFVGEVAVNFYAWAKRPHITERLYRRVQRGAPRKIPRLLSGSAKAQTVESLLDHPPSLRHQDWQAYRVKKGEKGPMVWEVKQCQWLEHNAVVLNHHLRQ